MRRSLNRVAGQGPIANACYSHLGGRLGKALMEHILKQRWLEPVEDKRFRLTDKGRKGLRDWGIDPGAIEAEGPKG